MTNQESKTILSKLFKEIYGAVPNLIIKLPASGSDRIYYRLIMDTVSIIGASNSNILENEAFFSFTTTFQQEGIKVPALIKIAPDRKHYLITDLGDDTLYRHITCNHKTEDEKSNLCHIKESLIELINIQLVGGKSIDFSKCYPRKSFDSQSIMWDLNYFKYNFLKLTAIYFDEQALEDDFQTLANFLLIAPSGFFMYRDFQTRNIMIVKDDPWFIDYQGGRKGPLQYDLASILYSPKTGLNHVQRDVLLDFYLLKLEEKIKVDKTDFINYYYGFVLIRILQALGAYGFRGLYEKKPNFKNSIHEAISNLQQLFNKNLVTPKLPEIKRIAAKLSQSKLTEKYKVPEGKLTIRITSFSYKKGYPDDPSENGGGFVFDCRGLPNPGRFEEYRNNSGLDTKVIGYLEDYPEVINFQENVQKLAEISIEEYLQRGFNHLSVSFGCTGGQHRSVYQAEKFAQWVQNNYPVNVVLIHTEKENWKSDE